MSAYRDFGTRPKLTGRDRGRQRSDGARSRQGASTSKHCGDRGIRAGRLGFFEPFEDPEFLETTGLIRFGLKRNTPGKWLRSSRPIGRRKPCRQPGAAAGHDPGSGLAPVSWRDESLGSGCLALGASGRSPTKRLSMVKRPARARGRRLSLQLVWFGSAYRSVLGCAHRGLGGEVERRQGGV
jgi:hypothetical protein